LTATAHRPEAAGRIGGRRVAVERNAALDLVGSITDDDTFGRDVDSRNRYDAQVLRTRRAPSR